MDKTAHSRFPILGIVLIFIGLGLLLDRFDLVNFGSERIIAFGLMFYGAGLSIRAFLYNEKGKAFGGTFFLLTGIVFFLSSINAVGLTASFLFPTLLFALGCSFFAMYFMSTKEWGLLVPAVFFTVIGLGSMAARLGYFLPQTFWDIFATYWPLLLVLWGLLLILRSRKPGVLSEQDHSQEQTL